MIGDGVTNACGFEGAVDEVGGDVVGWCGRRLSILYHFW